MYKITNIFLVKRICLTVCISILAAVFIFSFHLVFPSVINGHVPLYSHAPNRGLIDGVYLDSIVQYHRDHPVFALRQLTTAPIGFVSQIFNISPAGGFMVVQFVYLILCLYLLLTLTLRIYPDRFAYAVTSLSLFVLSFSVLFAFFTPIFTYDEFIQYAFLWGAMLFGLRKQYIGAIVCLWGAMLARETSALLFPSIIMILFPDIVNNTKQFFRQKRNVLWPFFFALVPALFYYVYLKIQNLLQASILEKNVLYLQTERMNHFAFNFSNITFGVESFMCLILVFLLPCYILFQSKFFQDSKSNRSLYAAWVIAFVVNTPLAFFTTRVQEARILALPLVLVWPFLGKYAYELILNVPTLLRAYGQHWKIANNRFVLFSYLLACGVIAFLGYVFVFYVYRPTHHSAFPIGYQLYAVSVILIVVVHYFLSTKLFLDNKEE